MAKMIKKVTVREKGGLNITELALITNSWSGV